MPVDVLGQSLPAPAGATLPRPFRVADVQRETHDTVTLDLRAVDGPGVSFAPGQFTMLQAFGVGEVPISISGDPARPERLVHTIRDVGGVTQTLCAVHPGDILGVRGAFGRGWEVADGMGGDVVVVAGGIGLAPLRSAVLAIIAHRGAYQRVSVLCGARTSTDVLFLDQLLEWNSDRDLDVKVTVDRAPTSWTGPVGMVTELLPGARFDPARTLALVCGPELMMRYVADALVSRGVRADRVRLSMERNMQCGVGLCGHCQLRDYLVCVHGPVFSLDMVRPHLGIPEL